MYTLLGQPGVHPPPVHAHALYKILTRKDISVSQFQLQVIKQILEISYKPQIGHHVGKYAEGENLLRLTEHHFPSLIPATKSKKRHRGDMLYALNILNRATQDIYVRNVTPLYILICFERNHTYKSVISWICKVHL